MQLSAPSTTRPLNLSILNPNQVNSKRVVTLNSIRYPGLSLSSCLYAGTLLLLPNTNSESRASQSRASHSATKGKALETDGNGEGGCIEGKPAGKKEGVSGEIKPHVKKDAVAREGKAPETKEGIALTMVLPEAEGQEWEPIAEWEGVLTRHDGKERCVSVYVCTYVCKCVCVCVCVCVCEYACMHACMSA